MTSKKLLSEPLLHFTVLGLALFVLYAWVNNVSDYAADEIVIDQARLSMLAADFEKTWQRAPSAEEAQGLIDGWIREEILYREGVAMGFDRDDPVIRRRVAQKTAFVADGMVPDTPVEADLEAWLRNNIDGYEIPSKYSLRQVYIDPQRHPDDLDSVLGRLQASLNGNDASKFSGDSTMLPGEITSTSSTEIERVFGTDFVDALAELSVGGWHGPIASGFGLHFVQVREHIPARQPDLEEVRSALERDVLNHKSQQINDAFYSALRKRYTVRFDVPEINE